MRWLLLDWLADTEGSEPYRAPDAWPGHQAVPGQQAACIVAREGTIVVETGPARFELGAGSGFPFQAVQIDGVPAVDAARTRFAVEDESGRLFLPHIITVQVEEPGPVRALVRVQGELAAAGVEPLADFEARLHFYAGSATVRFELTLRNARRADHPGGLWDLGNGGSIYLRDASLTVALPAAGTATTIRCSRRTRGRVRRDCWKVRWNRTRTRCWRRQPIGRAAITSTAATSFRTRFAAIA